MARQRALKKRKDYRGGGYVTRKAYVSGTTVTAPGVNPRTGLPQTQTKRITIKGGKPTASQAAATRNIFEADVDKISSTGTITAPKDIQKIEDPKALTKQKAITPDAVKTTKAIATDAQAQDDITAATYDAAQAEDLAATQAAQGQVTREA
tara:strand:+ start:884 stop:1336 length:453 start_codon:yes stop_codon:yes gene_type:complete